MIRKLVSRFASERQERALRARVREFRRVWHSRFHSYGPAELAARLRAAGITATDSLLVHANFSAESGFRGNPNDLVSVFADLVCERGNLLMVSQPFRGYARDYLERGKVFDVRRTVSMMGLVTEMFRRRPGTLRSLHPTHPVLAAGVAAGEIVAGHESSRFPCGDTSPFEWLKQHDGKILFFDVSTGANTFFHHVEDQIKDELGFPLYDSELFVANVIDSQGRPATVETYAFARGIVRHTDMLERELEQRGQLVRGRVGNSRFALIRASDAATAIVDLVRSGSGLIEPPGE